MKIKLAKTLGYCPGVRRAMDMAFEELSRRDGRVFSRGELIHNGPALELLAQKGLKIWAGETAGAVIIRAHGLPPEEKEFLAKTGLRVRDATCPKVLGVQKLVDDRAKRGFDVVIWGAADHPEVIGLMGHAYGRGRVISRAGEAADLPELGQVLLVSQTTQESAGWPEVVKAVLARWPEAEIHNTICEATAIRQNGLRTLAGEVDALIVVGGRNSGNTRRLVEIGRALGKKTLAAETAADLEADWFRGVATVGVAAGASTSFWQISQMLQALRAMGRAGENSWRGLGERFLRALVLSNIYGAAAMASMAVVAGALMNAAAAPIIFSVYFFYIVALHLLRDFARAQTIRFNAPDRTAFMAKYRRPLIGLICFSAFMALAASILASAGLTLSLLLMSLMVLAYWRLPRPAWGAASFCGRLRPVARPALLALGWTLLFVSAPLLAAGPTAESDFSAWPFLFTAVAVFCGLFALTTMSDFLSAQGDRIFGRPTLTTVCGEKAVERLLKTNMAVWALALAVGLATGNLPRLAAILIFAGPAYSFQLIKPLFKNNGLCGFRFEAARFGSALLTGLCFLLF
ncbi:MAG: 4-hydroxy-3-methylbut-2-enyl diphosphate reductase [Candidatus Adiutrix sp.]|jgi:4-hydroxy-3-methylbut-2-enyl diphosphate reductase|nr:4-hydroxy-3-methylbut-2-enyl diphosphate reductase [Candidatus Adiutrix sp.]